MYLDETKMTSPQSSERSEQSASSGSHMSRKRAFLQTYEREAATTLKVLRAYPAEATSLQPHERSSTALKLAWTFVVEQQMLIKAIKHESLFGSGAAKAPDSWAGVIDAFENGHRELVTLLRDSSNPDLNGEVQFFTGPKQRGDIPLRDFVWFMLHDQIHHRGQLSVYLRMAGGKVPSIYGPTADEPWN
jgi:uncharacterized damage-inducible protein DinB